MRKSKSKKFMRPGEKPVDALKRFLEEGNDPGFVIWFCLRVERHVRAIRQRAERQLMLSRREDNEGEEWKGGAK